MKLAVLIIFIFIVSSLWGQSRLDPHGRKNLKTDYLQIKKNKRCQICHIYSKRTKRYRLTKNVSGSCNACHNRSPHAGMVEHTGKRLEVLKIGLKGKMDCLSCHRPHRKAVSPRLNRDFEETMGTPVFIFITREERGNRDWEARKSIFPMLKRSCKDCHTKENLK